jgi:Xaa-Pro aminopeptidase
MTQNSHPTNRSRVPQSERFMNFISSNWAEIDSPPVTRWEVADHSLKRREALSAKFPGKVLVIEATEPRVRANDTDYRYRPATAFTHLTGWGSATVPGSVLVIDGRKNVSVSTLYLMPTAGRDSDEFFANPAIGEFWVGPRPTLTQVSLQLGIITKDLTKLDADLASIGAVVDMEDPELAEAASTLRFVKDQYEIAQMREAVRITVDGFAEVARSIPQATKQARGERVVETAFYSVARQNGFELGYETIAASGPNACILHWTKNDGEVKHGDLILVDAGAELESLYTADVTRTIPVNGKFSKEQLWVYNTVLEAADAAFAVVKPGIRFREVHNAAIEVIARRVAELGVIPVTAEEALEKDNQHHRRYMVHGTSHHLGLDVHDCAQARREMYQDGILEKGMIFTIEPGLYFHKSDLNLPPEYRGIGVRIEDDVLVTESGYENLSSALPRTASDVENWFAEQIS